MIIKKSKKKEFLSLPISYLKKIKDKTKLTYILIILIIFFSGSLTGGIAIQVTKEGLPYKYKIIDIFTTFKNIPRTILAKVKDKSEIIYIDVDFKNLQKLESDREKQLLNVYNLKSNESYVNAKIKNRNKNLNANIRLKGDGSKGNFGSEKKWSLRVKISGDERLFGLRKFSIQKPETLEYIYEWLFNKAFAAEGGISKRYHFVRVYFNGDYWGVMTFHEHFGDILIENNQRRTGPIIRFDTDHRIAALVRDFDMGERFSDTTTMPIANYQRNRPDDDKEFARQYRYAATLLEGLRRGKLKSSEVLDIEKFAIYAALVDLFEGYHGFIDGNMAFYYNPITSLLEPIAEDIDSGTHSAKLAITINDGFLTSSKRLWEDEETNIGKRIILQNLFEDINFIESYAYYLSKFSKRQYLNSFFDSIKDELNAELNTLYTDYTSYSFDIDQNTLHKSQSKIIKELNPPIGLLCYYKNTDEKNIYLSVGAVQYFPIEILSLSYENLIFPIQNEKKILFGKTKYDLVNYKEIIAKIPEQVSFSHEMQKNLLINYKIVGTDKVYSNKVYDLNILNENIELNFSEINSTFDEFKFLNFNKEEKTLYVKEGEWDLNKDLVIPEGLNFIVGPNTKINLSNKASIFSFSPVRILGTDSDPVVIESKDSTGEGILVMNAKGTSEINYVHFKNLSNPKKKGLKLLGALNFYETKVEIKNTVFEKNKSEDALNLVRVEAKIIESTFTDNYSDALDIDFSKVEIDGLNFENSGNDAIDTSGSVVKIKNVNIKKAGDKAVSIGEKSQISIQNLNIFNSNIAIAIKDLSEVEAKNIDIHDSKIGITAFQKKEEFGPGYAVLEKTSMHNVESQYMIEINSKVEIVDEWGVRKILDSDYKNLKRKFY